MKPHDFITFIPLESLDDMEPEPTAKTDTPCKVRATASQAEDARQRAFCGSVIICLLLLLASPCFGTFCTPVEARPFYFKANIK
jgi:hypothetical protein